jgi:hypothetical protein
MSRTLTRIALFSLAAAAVVAVPASAATRLTYVLSDKQVGVRWPNSAFPIRYEVDRRVVNSLPAGTIDRAFALWSGDDEVDLSFSGQVADGVQAGWNNRNSITIADGLFANQGALAYTSNWYDKNGNVTEADIQIDASLAASKYNVQQAVAHEIGHLLGLDHSAVLSSIMFPYLPRGADVPQLDSDDRIGILSVYPKNDPALLRGTLSGRVVNSAGGVFAAQVVAVNEKGEPVATTLSEPSGEFTLSGLPAGMYRVYAEPLDGPVETRNLTGIWRAAKVVSFSTQFLDNKVKVESGKILGNLILRNDDRVVDLNPRWVGVAAENSDQFALTSTASLVRNGDTINLAVAGDGIISGMTKFEVLNPGVERVSDFRYAGNYVYATFRVGTDASPGSAVLLLTSGDQTATLTGAIRILGTATRPRVARR